MCSSSTDNCETGRSGNVNSSDAVATGVAPIKRAAATPQHLTSCVAMSAHVIEGPDTISVAPATLTSAAPASRRGTHATTPAADRPHTSSSETVTPIVPSIGPINRMRRPVQSATQ